MGIEKFGGIESVEASDEVIRVHDEILREMIQRACAPNDKLDECVADWEKQHGPKFEAGFKKLLSLMPDSVHEWDSGDRTKREEIMDRLYGPIVDEGLVKAA